MKTLTKEYSLLFNEITDVSEDLAMLTKNLTKLNRRLIIAQQRTEEMYLAAEEEEGDDINSSAGAGAV